MANSPFPYFVGAATGFIMNDFDVDVWDTGSGTLVYKIIDALCGSTGAGQLLNANFINVLQGDLGTTYGADLDYFVGNIGFLPRTPSEMYTANAAVDLLNSDEWDEVRIKDAWYRARIKDFWAACNMGGTPEAIRMTCQAAVACDCNVYEVWRYIDNFGLTASLGRADARNEVVVQPLVSQLTPQEFKLLRDMLAKIMPIETVVTINTEGLAVLVPVPIGAAAASSTYFEIQKLVTATPVLSQLPPPDQLPIDLLPTEQWLWLAKTDPVLAPYAHLNISAQADYYYLIGGGRRSPIVSVTYGTLNPDGTIATSPNFCAYQSSSQFTPWTPWQRADSPDNYPGGRFGIHPGFGPPLNGDHTPYSFPWHSQDDYVAAQIDIVLGLGGNANTEQFQLPVAAPNQTTLAFPPDYAVAYYPPGRDSTVSANNFRRRPSQESGTQGWVDHIGFVRS